MMLHAKVIKCISCVVSLSREQNTPFLLLLIRRIKKKFFIYAKAKNYGMTMKPLRRNFKQTEPRKNFPGQVKGGRYF